MVHEGLEGGRSIAESKEHDSGFKKSHGGDEGGFPLIFFSDANVVVSPTNVEFGKQGGFLHIINEFRDEGEWIGISDSVGVQVAVILTWMKGSVLLQHIEEGGGFSSCFEMFFDKGFARFHLCWVEGINFGNLESEVWAKFNGVVVGTMRGELVVGLF